MWRSAPLPALILWMAMSALSWGVPTIQEVTENLICDCGTCPHMPVSLCQCGHADGVRAEVQALLAQGKTKDEILKSFVGRYGERILSMPGKKGFQLTAWVLPFLALAAGGWAAWSWVSGRKVRGTGLPGESGHEEVYARLRQEWKEKGL
ncbi:MAG: cytochrome c-type biogenesis protein CcmH [Acidobacteria bacterium]|nr:cytochrome c-type biogenesis protein CcmH [Acidobacteriota bacterium]